MYIFLPLATRVAYLRIIDTNQVFSDILRVSNIVVYVDYQCYKEIISAIRRYIMIGSRDFLTIFIEK